MSEINDTYKNPEYLVETDWLEQNLNNERLRIIDCSVNVVQNPNKEQATNIPFAYRSNVANFNQAHIPGAGYIDVANELSDSSSDIPLIMPPEQLFIEVMSRFGIAKETHVILYSTTDQNWATRLWWLLRSFGFTNASVLNGGWSKWLSEDRPTSNRACSYQPKEFIAQRNADLFIDKHGVLSAIGNDKIRIINALPSAMYFGTSNIAFCRKGRITDSVNIPFNLLQEPDSGLYLSAKKLRDLFDTVAINEAEHLITYCGGGIAASNDAFALALLGYENVAIYDGSLLEWGNDGSLPMESGNNTK